MSIALTDIPTAVADYLDTQVTTTVSRVTPTDPSQDVLTPGQEGSFSVNATNSDATKGVRLLNVMYHLTVANDSVLKLLAPSGAIVRGFEDVRGNQPIPGGDLRSEMFVRLLTETTLDAGQVGTRIGIELRALDQGETSVTAHLHADVALEEVFPTSRNKADRQDVEVL